jgi:hypothetical protein
MRDSAWNVAERGRRTEEPMHRDAKQRASAVVWTSPLKARL